MRRDFYELGLTGYPLGHSLSPRIHAAALREAGLAGVYRLYPVEPSDLGQAELRRLLERLRLGELHGLNVTIPHKQRLLPLLDRLSATAQEVGAVNTLFCQDGMLVGENTDAAGFTADLQRYLPGMPAREAHALVLGAGGSARAVVYALGGAGWEVRVAARRQEQCQAVAGRFSELGYAVQAVPFSLPSLAETLAENSVQLIVNTTPLGMGRLADASPWLEGLAFPQDCLVYDLIYNPTETLFMRQARAAGLRAANGLGMLLEQAALSFACWTAVRLQVDSLRRAMEEISFDPTD